MFGDNHDSDQSISEEEDIGLSKSSNNSFSLCDSQDCKERNPQVLSQLEILRRDASKFDATTSATISFEKIPTAFCVEDEIELPVFNNEDDSIHSPCMETVLDSDDEMIAHRQELVPICPSDDETIVEEEKLTFGSTKVDKRGSTWSEVNKEVEALVCLNENPGSFSSVGSFSKPNKSSKGGQMKVKRNLLFRFRSQGIAFSPVANEASMQFNDCSQTNELHASANRDVQYSKFESGQIINVRDSEKQKQNLLSLEGPYKDCNAHSVTELLESLQEKHGRKLGNSEMHYRLKGRKTKDIVNKSTSNLGDRTMDDLLDVVSSSEEEDNLPKPMSILKQRTIVDQFHEAFEAVPQKDLMSNLIFHRVSSSGLFESLQQVLAIEKEREMDYLKNYGADGNSTDGRGFLDVRILSRSLEAKLIVCCCTLVGDVQNLKWLSNFQMRNLIGERILTIMFCSRVCSNVELEVGNLIRLYPPWKEVNVEGKDEIIILSAYFSQII